MLIDLFECKAQNTVITIFGMYDIMVEILKGIHQIDGVNANSYLVLEDDGSLILIDTGTSAGGKKILEVHQDKPLKTALGCKNDRPDARAH